MAPRDNASSTTLYFLEHYQETDSVRRRKASVGNIMASMGNIMATIYALPALSQEDWSVLQASASILQSICGQLQIKQLIYCNTDDEIDPLEQQEQQQQQSMRMDVHYCSQIRQMARAPMLHDVAMVEEDIESQRKAG
jgi:hypothetical protein